MSSIQIHIARHQIIAAAQPQHTRFLPDCSVDLLGALGLVVRYHPAGDKPDGEPAAYRVLDPHDNLIVLEVELVTVLSGPAAIHHDELLTKP